MTSKPLGQRFDGKFQPSPTMSKQLGVDEIDVAAEYLGSNIKVMLKVDRHGALHGVHEADEVYDLARFRAAAPNEVIGHFGELVGKLAGKIAG